MRSRPGKVRLKSTRQQLRAQGLLLDPPEPSAILDLPGAFDNDRPVEVEIGPGKGAFALRRAAARPEINLLAVEWVPSYACYVADRARRAGLANLRSVCADAEALFAGGLARQCLQRVHIYFPDPWPKRRHRRRRLIKVPFIRRVRDSLGLGGWLGIATDHAEYYGQIRGVLAAVDGLAPVPFPPDADAWLGQSSFKRRYADVQHRCYTLAAIRWK